MIIHNVKEGEYEEDKEILRAIHEAYGILDPVKRSREMVQIITEDYVSWHILKEVDSLSLTERAIENNPKSYQAWYHRLYLYRKDPVLVLEKIKRETKLIGLLLEFDKRNFHCWNYKAFLLRTLRGLVDLEGPVSEEELREIRERGVRVYPNSTKDLEKTIPMIDEYMRVLKEVGKDVSNYSYLHAHGGFDPCAAVYTDPFDEGIWAYYHQKREETLLSGGFYVRRYEKRLEVHFLEPYSGPVVVVCESMHESQGTHESQGMHESEGMQELNFMVPLPTRVFVVPITTHSQSLSVNGRVLTPFSDNSLFLEIQELEPSCLFNYIFHPYLLTRETVEGLKAKDPLRAPYYETLVEDLYTLYT